MDAVVISNPQYISPKAAGLQIGMSADFVIERLIYPKTVKAVKLGSRWQIDLESWQRYLASVKAA